MAEKGVAIPIPIAKAIPIGTSHGPQVTFAKDRNSAKLFLLLAILSGAVAGITYLIFKDVNKGPILATCCAFLAFLSSMAHFNGLTVGITSLIFLFVGLFLLAGVWGGSLFAQVLFGGLSAVFLMIWYFRRRRMRNQKRLAELEEALEGAHPTTQAKSNSRWTSRLPNMGAVLKKAPAGILKVATKGRPVLLNVKDLDGKVKMVFARPLKDNPGFYKTTDQRVIEMYD